METSTKKKRVESEEKGEGASQFKDSIVVMPEQFYGVVSKVKPMSTPKKITKEHKKPLPPKKPTKVFPKKKNYITPIMISIGLVLILGSFGYLMYLKYYTAPEVVVEPEPEPVVVVIPKPIPKPVPEPEPVPEPIPEPEPEPEPTILSQMHSFDTDGDGLTDAEELLFNLELDSKDTDNDGFQDGTEFINLYNPKDTVPARLEFSGLVSTYVNPTFDYDVFYPREWFARSIDQVNREILLSSILGEFVTVKVMEKNPEQDVKVWYLNTHTDITSTEMKDFVNYHKIDGVMSQDEFTVYFAKGNNVYELRYNIGLKKTASYPNIFKMIYESFIFH